MTIPWLTAATAIAFGACAGSFATTAAIRTARAEQSLLGRSHCDACSIPLPFSRTVPVLSFCRSGGMCAACGARIDPLHPLGEIAGAAIALASILVAPPAQAIVLAALGLVLLATSIVDLKTLRLPDLLTAAAAVLCMELAWRRGLEVLWIGLAAALLSLVVLEAIRRLFGALRRDPGLGFGDVKLIGALAIWLGFSTPWMVVIASASGLFLFALVRPQDGRLPFGPLIAASAWIVGLAQEAHLGHS